MHLFRYFLNLIYLITFTADCSSEDSVDVSSDEYYMLTAEESAELGKLIIEGDDKRALVDLLTMAELNRVESFRHL